MPFNFKEYEAQCSRKSRAELQKDLRHYDNVVTGASAGTGISIITAPLTMGVSLLAIGGTAPAIHNARKKRAILRRHLQQSEPEVRPLFSSAPVPRRERSLSASSSDLPPYDPRSAPSNLQGEKETYDERSSASTLASPDANTPPAYNEAGYRADTQFAPPSGPPPSSLAKEYNTRITEHEL